MNNFIKPNNMNTNVHGCTVKPGKTAKSFNNNNIPKINIITAQPVPMVFPAI